MRWLMDFFMCDSWQELIWAAVLGLFMAFGFYVFIWVMWFFFG